MNENWSNRQAGAKIAQMILLQSSIQFAVHVEMSVVPHPGRIRPYFVWCIAPHTVVHGIASRPPLHEISRSSPRELHDWPSQSQPLPGPWYRGRRWPSDKICYSIEACLIERLHLCRRSLALPKGPHLPGSKIPWPESSYSSWWRLVGALPAECSTLPRRLQCSCFWRSSEWSYPRPVQIHSQHATVSSKASNSEIASAKRRLQKLKSGSRLARSGKGPGPPRGSWR